jgi:hypothetical protein
MSWDEAARIFNVIRSTISRWYSKLDDSGSLADRYRSTCPRKIDSLALIDYISVFPDATLWGIAAKFDSYLSVIDYHLRKLQITRKKNYALCGAKRGKA